MMSQMLSWKVRRVGVGGWDRLLGGVVTAVMWWMAAPAGAELILAYDASNATGGLPASEFAVGVTPLELTRGEGLGAATGGTYNSSGWTDETTDYLQWGWTSSSPLDLTDLDLRYDRSGTGPTSLEIMLSVNGGPMTSIFTDLDVSDTGEDAVDIDLSAFQQVTSAVFQLYGSGASSAGGTFDLEPLSGVIPDRGIQINGVASVVPEPSSMLLAGLACGLLVVRHRRAMRDTLAQH